MLRFIELSDILHEVFWSMILMGGICYFLTSFIVTLPCEIIRLLTKKSVPGKVQRKLRVFATACLTSFFASRYYEDQNPQARLFVLLAIWVVCACILLIDVKDIFSHSKRKETTIPPQKTGSARPVSGTGRTSPKLLTQKPPKLVQTREETDDGYELDQCAHPDPAKKQSHVIIPNGYETLKGDYVRSRAEATIADLLYQVGIPYEYERLLMLDDQFVRPDFTIWISQDGEPVYWEHCGMLSDGEYRAKWKKKKETYEKHNIIEGKNLIVTNSTDSTKFQKIVEDLRMRLDAQILEHVYDI